MAELAKIFPVAIISRSPAAMLDLAEASTLGWQLVAADVAITDVSAMVYDRLATGKPLIVACPTSENADIDLGGYLGSAEWLDSADAASIVVSRRFHPAVEALMGKWHSHAAIYVKDQAASLAPFDETDDA